MNGIIIISDRSIETSLVQKSTNQNQGLGYLAEWATITVQLSEADGNTRFITETWRLLPIFVATFTEQNMQFASNLSLLRHELKTYCVFSADLIEDWILI